MQLIPITIIFLMIYTHITIKNKHYKEKHNQNINEEIFKYYNYLLVHNCNDKFKKNKKKINENSYIEVTNEK